MKKVIFILLVILFNISCTVSKKTVYHGTELKIIGTVTNVKLHKNGTYSYIVDCGDCIIKLNNYCTKHEVGDEIIYVAWSDKLGK